MFAWFVAVAAADCAVSACEGRNALSLLQLRGEKSQKTSGGTGGTLKDVRADGKKLLSFIKLKHAVKKGCTLPPQLARHFQNGTYDMAQPERLLLQGKPFTYLRWGDGDWFEAMKQDSPLYQTMKRYSGDERVGNFFPVLGTFFLCGNDLLNDGVKRLVAKLDDGEVPPFYPRFYMDIFGAMNAVRHPTSDEKRLALVQWDDPSFGVNNFDRLTCEDNTKNSRPVVLVGEAHLNQLSKLLQHELWIDSKNAMGRQDELLGEVLKASQKWPKDNVVFIFAVSIAGRTIAEKAYQTIGQKDTVIDVGASLDFLAGKFTRDYHAKAHADTCKTLPCYVIGC